MEILFSTLVPSTVKRRAKIQIDLKNSHIPKMIINMISIKVTNSDLNVTVVNSWKTQVTNRIHNLMRDREAEVLPPPLNRNLRDHELSEEEGQWQTRLTGF